MFYFIPSWYGNSERIWNVPNEPWYKITKRIEFDDTINQIRMFKSMKEDTSVVVLNYTPQLRYFLHRQDIFDVKYWSIFDDIQGFNSNESIGTFDYRDISWPMGVEFFYTPFTIIVKRRDELFAHIEFSLEGNVIWINFFEKNTIGKRYIFDDRGYLSSIIYYENGIEKHQDYLNTSGIWKIREHIGSVSKEVEVNKKFSKEFSKLRYENIEELIQEKLENYISTISKYDYIVLAADNKHNELVFKSLNKKVILSFFGDRYNLLNKEKLMNDIANSLFVVTDSVSTENNIVNSLKGTYLENKRISHISTFDTRLELGISQRQKYLQLYLVVNGMSDEVFENAIIKIGHIMKENKFVDLILGSYSINEAKNLERKAIEIIKNNIAEDFFDTEDDKKDLVLTKAQEKEEHNRVVSKAILQETELISVFETIRLIVDLNEQPDIFTQIAGVSAGIPQINIVESPYVEHLKNGYVIKNLTELPKAINYYFEGLRNWNDSLVYSVQLIEKYTDGKIIERWKEYIAESENGKKN